MDYDEVDEKLRRVGARFEKFGAMMTVFVTLPIIFLCVVLFLLS